MAKPGPKPRCNNCGKCKNCINRAYAAKYYYKNRERIIIKNTVNRELRNKG